MGVIQRIAGFIDRVVFTINILSMLTFFIIMCVCMCGVVFRVFGSQISGLTNMAELLLAIAIYLGIAYTQQMKKHVSMELFVVNLKEKHKRVLEIVNLIIAVIIIGIALICCWDYAIKAWQLKERMDGAPFYPIYPAKIAVGVGFTALWIQVVADLLREIKKR